MVADITIFAFLWGDTHNHFVEGWVKAIEALEIAPADVVVATDVANPADLSGVPFRIMHLDMSVENRLAAINTMVQSCQTLWVGECDIDDRLTPEAFRYLEDARGYDACANTIRMASNGGILPSKPEMFHSVPRMNHVMVNSYFTKEIFDRVGGYPTDAYFPDWGLWWKLHKHDAKWFRSPGVQMEYNDIPHPNRGSQNFASNAVDLQVAWMESYQATVEAAPECGFG